MAEAGKEHHAKHNHQDGAGPADNHRRHGPKPSRGHARFELAQLVGRPDKERVHGATRPRISSGVASWIKVIRTYTLTISEAPSIVSATIDLVKSVESPNTIVATPKIAIQANIAKPALRRKGTRPRNIPVSAAPIAGALRSRPRPPGPTRRISRA